MCYADTLDCLFVTHSTLSRERRCPWEGYDLNCSLSKGNKKTIVTCINLVHMRLLIPWLDEKCERNKFLKTFLNDGGNDHILLYKNIPYERNLKTVVDLSCLHFVLPCFSCLDERLKKILLINHYKWYLMRTKFFRTPSNSWQQLFSENSISSAFSCTFSTRIF